MRIHYLRNWILAKFPFIWLDGRTPWFEITRPDTRQPRSRAGVLGPYLRSLEHLARGGVAINPINAEKVKGDGRTEGQTERPIDWWTNGPTKRGVESHSTWLKRNLRATDTKLKQGWIHSRLGPRSRFQKNSCSKRFSCSNDMNRVISYRKINSYKILAERHFDMYNEFQVENTFFSNFLKICFLKAWPV